MTNALNNVIVTTSNLTSARRYYEDGLKMRLVNESFSDPGKIKELWGLDKEYPVRSLVYKRRPEDGHGFIRLVELEGAEGANIRSNTKPWDYGIFDIGFVVQDQPSKIKEIENLGYEVFATPTRYDFDYYKEEGADQPVYYVIDSVVTGPDETYVDLLERVNPPYPYGRVDEATGFTEVIHSLLVVEDMDQALRFFHELLGIPIRGAFKDVNEPQFHNMLKIPVDEKVDWSFVADIEAPGSFVEIIRFHGSRGMQITRQSDPLNFGIAALSFRVDSLDAVYDQMIEADIEIIRAPLSNSLDGVGTVDVFSCYGPSGILCEVFEKKEP